MKFQTETVEPLWQRGFRIQASFESALNSNFEWSYGRYLSLSSNEETYIHFLGSASTNGTSTLS